MSNFNKGWSASKNGKTLNTFVQSTKSEIGSPNYFEIKAGFDAATRDTIRETEKIAA